MEQLRDAQPPQSSNIRSALYPFLVLLKIQRVTGLLGHMLKYRFLGLTQGI